MDEFTKTMIAAVVGGGLTILGGIVAKVIDIWASILKEKRDFIRSGREKAREEIDELKNEVGTIYELSISGKVYREKQLEYEKFFAKEHEVIGRYNKYPDIAQAARDTLHFCKIIRSDERDREIRHLDSSDLLKNTEALTAQYQAFIQACNSYIQTLA